MTFFQKYPLTVGRFLLPSVIGILLCIPSDARAEAGLTEAALADLVKPSVVRIAERVVGTASIPTVTVDIKKKSVSVVSGRFTEIPVDEYLTGTGFIIHPDGYIATNAHVVSLDTVKTMLASESALAAVYENALLLSEDDLDAFFSEEDGKAFAQYIVRYVVEQSEFDLEHSVAVLRPGAESASIGELLAQGFPVTSAVVHEGFMEDDRDVAIVKIEEENLPALALGEAGALAVGQRVYLVGFPATAEINEENPSEATFTSGVVSAIKHTVGGDLRIFQTDAKVSRGSSGGPLLNEHGEVLGMVAFQTDELTRAAGDNFAFALPIDVVSEQAFEARILPEEGVYGRAFRDGLRAFAERHCDTALAAFDRTKKTNGAFLTDRIVQPYGERCREWQESGEARDTYWEEFRDGVRSLSNPLITLIGGGILSFGIFGAMMLWLLRQLRKEEREIVSLERRLEADERKLDRYEQRTAGERLAESSSVRKPGPNTRHIV